MERKLIVRPGDRFDHWHQVTCRRYSRTECTHRPSADFCAKVSLQDFGPIVLNEISSATDASDPIRVVRSPSDIRQDSRDEFFLWFALGGTTIFEQLGGTVMMQPGDIVLHDQARPFKLEFGAWSHAAMAAVPRALLTGRIASAERLVAQKISRSSSLGALAGSVFRELLYLNDHITPATAGRIAGAALDIWSSALESHLTDTSAGTSLRQRRLNEVKSYMLANLGDPGLDLERISSARNMSSSTLIRLFASEGVTPIRWLWQQRLNASYQALAEGRVRYVQGAAMRFGFNDASRFSRAFKAQFGRTPGEVLKGVSSFSVQ